jgi:pilus assembly protein CpaF
MSGLRERINQNFKLDDSSDMLFEDSKLANLLRQIRNYISEERTEDLGALIEDPRSEEQLRKHISEYLTENKIEFEGMGRDSLVQLIYSGMAGFDFLDELIRDPNVETINGNAYFTQVKYAGKEKIIYPKHFRDTAHARNVLWKMCQWGDKVLDASHPDIDSQIGVGIRVSAIIPPLTRKEVGVTYSIRKQRKDFLTPEQMVGNGTLTQEEMDCLLDFARYGIPLVFSGQQDTGKTNDVNVIARTLPREKSIFIIEDNTELDIEQHSPEGRVLNHVVYTTTRDSDVAALSRTLDNLFVKSLRYNVDVLIPSELRGAEAYAALQAGLAGACTLTTLHAENARDTYLRLHSMCKASPAGQGIDDSTIYRDLIAAYPIVVHKHKLKDTSRRVMEIVEAVDYVDGQVVCNTLFEFKITRNEYHEDGSLTVHGRHTATPDMLSERLYDRMLRNGAPDSVLKKYRKKTRASRKGADRP